ncbi:MAG TPA: hypothetical protein VEF36_05800 [Roseiarcus sp.]|nr:hypothetical protein [Roseiarcus sp.]
MLEARPSKRGAAHRFSRDVRFDVFEADAKIGALVYDIKSESATFDVRGEAFAAARERKRRDERLYEAAWRKVSGSDKPPANPMLLKDAGGAVLAQADAKGAGWLIARGSEVLELRRRSVFSRLHDLYRGGGGQALGWVGQRKFFTTRLHVDLPSEFDAPFQIFTLALALDLTFVSLDRLNAPSA